MISIVTANRNRLPELLKVIPSWQKADLVSEIIVVDFGSDQPIEISHFQSSAKIRVVRTLTSSTWRIGLAINIGCDFATESKILKLDSDMELLEPERFKEFDLTSSFYRGHYKGPISNGQVFFAKQHWQAVGGYNEWLSGYGFDDTDYYIRLRNSGVEEKRILPNLLREHSHSHDVRVRGSIETEFVNLPSLTPEQKIEYLNACNTFLAMMRAWNPSLRTQYSSTRRDDGIHLVQLGQFSSDYRWSDALANVLAVVRMSGSKSTVSLLHSVVLGYIADAGGF